MKIEVSSWPAAAVIISAILATAAVLVTLGWRSPAFAASLGGLAATTVAGLLPQALARKDTPKPAGPYRDLPEDGGGK